MLLDAAFPTLFTLGDLSPPPWKWPAPRNGPQLQPRFLKDAKFEAHLGN
jgi:hypothetical protein